MPTKRKSHLLWLPKLGCNHYFVLLEGLILLHVYGHSEDTLACFKYKDFLYALENVFRISLTILFKGQDTDSLKLNKTFDLPYFAGVKVLESGSM